MGRFAKVLLIGLAIPLVLGWMILVTGVGMVMHSPVSPPGLQDIPPGVHADEAVQWSLAKDAAARSRAGRVSALSVAEPIRSDSAGVDSRACAA